MQTTSSTLRSTLAQSVILEEKATSLRDAQSIDELTRIWWEECDVTPEGDVRDALREVYSEMVKHFAPGMAG